MFVIHEFFLIMNKAIEWEYDAKKLYRGNVGSVGYVDHMQGATLSIGSRKLQ